MKMFHTGTNNSGKEKKMSETTTEIPVAHLKAAYEGSYFTIAGAGGDLQEWVDGLNGMMAEVGAGQPENWYQTTGQDINEYADKIGEVNDRFPDDLTVLMFPLSGMNTGVLAMFKLQIGARWFDDVIDNMTAGE